MKRHKGSKKIKLPPFVKDARDAIIGKFTGAIVFFIFALLIILLARSFVYSSDYFKLRTIDLRDAVLDQKTASYIGAQLLNIYKGRNVFTLSLRPIADSLRRAYPDSKDVVLKIAMPDKLVVGMKFRKPVALVRNIKYYAVDDEGFILPTFDVSTLKNLPVIEGADIRYNELRGKKSVSKNLKLALELLRQVKNSRVFSEHGLTTINAASPESLSFYIKEGVEVIIGPDNFSDKLETLEKTLKDPRLAMDKIKYIDLRFSEVTIGPR